MSNAKETGQVVAAIERNGVVGGAATEATLQLILAKETTIEIDAAAINLNTDTLEALGATSNTNTTAIAAVEGITTGAAVITDANGTIQQYLRGLVKLFITAGGALVTASLAAGANLIGKVGIDQTTPGTTNATSLAQIGATTVTTGAGASGAGTQRVITATDSTIGIVTTLSTLTSGNVGGFTTYVSSTPVMSVAGAYATGDYIGTTTSPQAFTSVVRTSGGTGVINSLVISDKITTTNVAMELWLFSATFVAPTDNAAWAISDAEALTVLGIIPISTAKWYASSNNQVYVDDTISIVIKPAVTSLFYALVARGTTPAFTSADLTINLGILQD